MDMSKYSVELKQCRNINENVVEHQDTMNDQNKMLDDHHDVLMVKHALRQ